MNWIVVVDQKTDRMGIMTREERDAFLEVCRKLKTAVPTRVIAKFDTMEEAIKYAKDIYEVNQLIDKL
jgi:hypothetical protein